MSGCPDPPCWRLELPPSPESQDETEQWFRGALEDGIQHPGKPSPSSFCTGSWDTKSLPFSTRSGVKPFPRFLERGQKLFPFTLQYLPPGTRVFLWNIIKKVLFFTQITQANEHVDWEWDGRQELDPGAAARTLRWGKCRDLSGTSLDIFGPFLDISGPFSSLTRIPLPVREQAEWLCHAGTGQEQLDWIQVLVDPCRIPPTAPSSLSP